MGIRGVEDWRPYRSIGDSTRGGWAVPATTNMSISASGGRFDAPALFMAPPGASSTTIITRALTATASVFLLGFAHRQTSAPTGGVDHDIVRCLGGANEHLVIRLTNTGFAVIDGPGGQIGSTVYTAGVDHWWSIELEVRDSPNGRARVYLDESMVVSLAANDLCAGGVSYVDSFAFKSASSGGSHIFSHVIWGDGAGGNNTSLLPDLRLDQHVPTSSISGSFAPTGGAGNNYQQVDETTPPDEDTTTVTADAAGDRDQYGLANLSVTPDHIRCVAIRALAKKTDAGARSLRVGAVSGGTESTSTFALATGYEVKDHIMDLDPSASVSWTVSSVNALTAVLENV